LFGAVCLNLPRETKPRLRQNPQTSGSSVLTASQRGLRYGPIPGAYPSHFRDLGRGIADQAACRPAESLDGQLWQHTAMPSQPQWQHETRVDLRKLEVWRHRRRPRMPSQPTQYPPYTTTTDTRRGCRHQQRGHRARAGHGNRHPTCEHKQRPSAGCGNTNRGGLDRDATARYATVT